MRSLVQQESGYLPNACQEISIMCSYRFRSRIENISVGFQKRREPLSWCFWKYINNIYRHPRTNLIQVRKYDAVVMFFYFEFVEASFHFQCWRARGSERERFFCYFYTNHQDRVPRFFTYHHRYLPFFRSHHPLLLE